MGNTNARGRTSARRAAALLAALGALVMSSGLALVVTATPANAAKIHKSYVCKYVKTPGQDTEQLQTGNNPIWVDNHSLAGSPDTVKVGDKFNDAQGYSVVIVANTAKLNPEPTIADCTSENPPPPLDEASATVEFTDPTCESPSSGSITKSADQASFVVVPDQASYAIGDSVTVTANADRGAIFGDGTSTQHWSHKFEASDAVDGVCSEVNPPQKEQLTTGSPSFTEPSCTTPAGVTLPKQAEVIPSTARAAAGPVVTTSDANGIHYVATGSLTPGGTVDVDATLLDPEHTAFAEGAQKHWSYTFKTPTGCSTVAPPTSQVESNVVVSPPKAKTPKTHAQATTVTPTVVEAGLASTTRQDLRSQQGLALVVAGMVMLIGAGGLTLRVRRGAARI